MLGKENAGEQVADNQSRLIRMQKEDTLPSSSQQILKLPEGFTVGKAIGGGDCFFDAVAQGLNQLKPQVNFTVKSLREVCRKQALEKQALGDHEIKDKIIKNAKNRIDTTIVLPRFDISESELWKTYLIGVVYTVEDVEEMKVKSSSLYKKLTNLKYGSMLKVPIWGRPEIEGKIICSEYKVRLHLIEVTTTVDEEDILLHHILSSKGYEKNILNDEIFSNEVYNREDTIHILNKGKLHFEPILKRTIKEPYREFANIVESYSFSESEKIEKLKAFFKVCPRLDINFQVNEHNDTPLHIAVYRGEFKTSKFLLKIGASVSISNIDGKTPIDIARDNNRKDIAKILQPLASYKKVDVPGDGNCLFWSVALAYLTFINFDHYTFSKRFKKLFEENCNVQMRRLIQGYADIYNDNTLKKLVTKVLRSKVINEMYHSQEEFKNKISMEDFLEIHNGGYFTEGVFKKSFENKFNAKKIQKYGIDTSKFQPNFLDKSAIKDICTELSKVQKHSETQEFIFETYLKCMEMPKSWGGEHEIKAMSKLLETAIIVSQEGTEDYIYNEEKKYFSKIYLSYEKGQHYQFYQVEYSNLMKFVLDFVQLFEIKLTAYDILGNILRQEKRMFPQEIKENDFVRSIFGFSACTGSRIMSDVRASLKRGNVIKATKSFINLSDLIGTFNEYKLGFRKILIDAGCNIFQSFEMQFEKIGFDHVSKVANDLIDQIIKYYIQKEYEKKLGDIGIAEALVSDKYLQEAPDKIVQYEKKVYNLKDLYENIGIAREEKDSFIYYRRDNKDSQYGYRRFLIGEKSGIIYTRVETTNEEFENYKYTLDLQDLKDIKEKVFYIVNKEIQVPNTKVIEGIVVKVKSHIERELNSLVGYVIPYCARRKQSIAMHMRSFKKTGDLSESESTTNSKNQLYRVKENSKILSLMEKNLKEISNSHYCQKVKEAFVDRAKIISQEYSNLSELQYIDAGKSKNLWLRVKSSNIKALAFLLGKMNFKDVCPPVEEFTGRQEQIEEVYKKLQKGTVVIIGPPGVGKTQLARKYVERNRKVYFHVYEADIESMLSIESSFASFIQDKLAMSMEEEKGNGKKRCLFLFEGAKKEDVKRVLKIMGKKGGFDCLFTSSDHGYQDVAEVTLEDLKEGQAEQLVKKVLNITDRLQDEQIKELVSMLKGFPLAIKQAATYIKNRKFGIYEYLVQYKDYDQILSQSTEQNECDRVLQITSLISIKAIQEVDPRREILEVLNVMAYFGHGQIDPGLFLNSRRDENELYSIFELLEQYSMIHVEEEDDYKMYVMHELVKKAIRLQFSADKEEQVLSHAIKLVCEIGEDFYQYVGHFLSLFYHSRGYGSLVKENCHLAHTILSALNALCEYKKALSFGLEAFEVFITTNEETAMARYEIACTKVALGEYDSALKIFLGLKREEVSKCIFSPLSLDEVIVSIYFRQKRYENALSYLRSDEFLFTELPNGKNQYCVDNYLSIVNTVAKIFIMQERYTDALTILHYEEELRGEIFLKKNDFNPCDNPYFYPSDIHEFYNLEAKYTHALTCFFVSQSRREITIEEEMLPHKEYLPRELSIPVLFNQLQDILKNQEGSQYLQLTFYSVKGKIKSSFQREVREKTLQRFEVVMQLQKDYGFPESHPKVLSVKFYIALLYSCLGDREKALQELQRLQELREKVIGVNHPDTLITVDAIQELFAKDEDKLTYLKNEIEKRRLLLQLEKSDLNIRGVSVLKEMYAKKGNNDYSSANENILLSSRELLLGNKRRYLGTENIQAKNRKIDDQQQVSNYLNDVNVDLNHQQDAIVNL